MSMHGKMMCSLGPAAARITLADIEVVQMRNPVFTIPRGVNFVTVFEVQNAPPPIPSTKGTNIHPKLVSSSRYISKTIAGADAMNRKTDENRIAQLAAGRKNRRSRKLLMDSNRWATRVLSNFARDFVRGGIAQMVAINKTDPTRAAEVNTADQPRCFETKPPKIGPKAGARLKNMKI